MKRNTVNPRCTPGSIEHQTDMCEEGRLRGEQSLHNPHSRGEFAVSWMSSDDNRENAEMSGDDHSSGLQGGEEEIEHQAHIDPGTPGAETEKDEILEEIAEERIEELK